MRTEPFVIDVTVTGFISGFICGPKMPKFYTFFFWGGGGESIGGAGPTRGTGNSNTVYNACRANIGLGLHVGLLNL